MNSGAVFTSNKRSVVGGELVVAEGQVLGDAIALDLDDHGVGIGGERSDHVKLNRPCRAHANRQGVGGGELCCVIEVDGSCCGKNASRARLW